MVKKNIFRTLLVLGILFHAGMVTLAQIEKGGIPRSLNLNLDKSRESILQVPAPNLSQVLLQDNQDALLEKPYRIGIDIPVMIDSRTYGSWYTLGDGSKMWILEIQCLGATGIGVDFSNFSIPSGADLYISNNDYSHITGAFNSDNRLEDGSFTVRPVFGDQVRIEYHQDSWINVEPDLQIRNLNYIYRGFDRNILSGSGFGGSEDCEVNISCSEGSSWEDQANGVVRILSRVGGQSFWCTGSLLNNSALDFSPLLLTANHCAKNLGVFATPADMMKWVFYFRYQSTGCENPVYEPHEYSMTGAVRLAASQNPDEIGSDFYLCRLAQLIPSTYNAYYNGWSIDEAAAQSGVCIHHPQGDIKKISTYTKVLESGNWQSIPNTHWVVEWSATENGFGVTEAGSSGSPLFDANGLIVGSLTGGESACTYQEGKDYFGKFSFSWDSNGTIDSMRLEPWLDPANTGRSTIEGAYNNLNVIADFKADTTIIAVGSSLNFTDLSLRNPSSWHWEFEGADPFTSSMQNPVGIKYDSCGKFQVKLSVSNQYGLDSLVKTGYIEVKSLLFPNPSQGVVTIFTNSASQSQAIVNIFDANGRFLTQHRWSTGTGPAIEIDLPRAGNLFFLQIIQGEINQVHKVVVLRTNTK